MRRAFAALLVLPFALPLAAQVAAAPAIKARFLGKAEAAKVLAADDYFGLLHAPELRAKTGLPLADMDAAQARAAGKAFYAASAQDFSAEEEATLQAMLDTVAPKLADKLPLMARTPFAFIKSGVEGGLPHTRGACIVLSPRMLSIFVMVAQKSPAGLEGAASLLVHEQTHVLERQHPELFGKLFTDIFGFRRIPSAPDAPALAEGRVVNPDGPDLAWAFPAPDGKTTRWIRPDLLLKETVHPRMPQDFREVAVGLVEKDGAFALATDAQGAPKVEDLGAVAAYATAFSGVEESFHPNEIAAELFADWIAGNPKDADQPLRQRTAAWARQNLR